MNEHTGDEHTSFLVDKHFIEFHVYPWIRFSLQSQ